MNPGNQASPTTMFDESVFVRRWRDIEPCDWVSWAEADEEGVLTDMKGVVLGVTGPHLVVAPMCTYPLHAWPHDMVRPHVRSNLSSKHGHSFVGFLNTYALVTINRGLATTVAGVPKIPKDRLEQALRASYQPLQVVAEFYQRCLVYTREKAYEKVMKKRAIRH